MKTTNVMSGPKKETISVRFSQPEICALDEEVKRLNEEARKHYPGMPVWWNRSKVIETALDNYLKEGDVL